MQSNKLYQALKNDADFLDGNFHQAILNVGYKEWQSRKEDWNYMDMVEWVEKEYGSLPRLLIQLGKYNQQVENGGHTQYIFNGYASDGKGDLTLADYMEEKQLPLHDYMVDLFDKYQLQKLKCGQEVYNIISDMKNNMSINDEENIFDECPDCEGIGDIENYEECDECGGEGEIGEDEFCDNCDGNGEIENYESCGNCRGLGEEEVPNPDYGEVEYEGTRLFDDDYYQFSKQWMEELNQLAKRVIDGQVESLPDQA